MWRRGWRRRPSERIGRLPSRSIVVEVMAWRPVSPTSRVLVRRFRRPYGQSLLPFRAPSRQIVVGWAGQPYLWPMPDRARSAQLLPTTNVVAGQRPRTPEPQIAKLQQQVGNRAVAAFVDALAVQRVKEGDGPSHDVGVIQQQLNAVGAAPR